MGAKGIGKAGLGLALLCAVAGCSQPGVTRTLLEDRPTAIEPRLGYHGLSGAQSMSRP